MRNYTTIKKELLKNAKTKQAYDALGPEFEVIQAIIKKRLAAGITQAELAKKIGTKQSAISRLESGSYNPSIALLHKISAALNATLHISIK